MPTAEKNQLYFSSGNESTFPLIFALFLLFFSVSSLAVREYLASLVCIFIAGWPILKIIRTLQAVTISGDSIVVSYLLRTYTYQASEVETIDWAVTLVLESYLPLHYRSYTSLLIQLVNGKKIKIPGSPYSSFDMRKTLLDWCRTYNPTVLENISREGINSLS